MEAVLLTVTLLSLIIAVSTECSGLARDAQRTPSIGSANRSPGR